MNQLQKNMLRFGTKNLNEQDVNVGRGDTIKIGNNEYRVNIYVDINWLPDLDFNLDIKDVSSEGGFLDFNAVPDSVSGRTAFKMIKPDNLDKRIIGDIGPENISLNQSDPRVSKAIKQMQAGQNKIQIEMPRNSGVAVTVTFTKQNEGGGSEDNIFT